MPLQIPDQAIAAQVPEGPDALTRISSLVDLQNKRNTGEIQKNTITSGNIKNSSDQSNLDEENGIRSVMQNYADYHDPQGNIDLNKFGPAIMKAAPTKGADILSKVIGLHTSAAEAKTAMAKLDTQQQGRVSQFMGALANNGETPTQHQTAIADYGELHPELKPVLGFMGNSILAPVAAAGDAKAYNTALLGISKFGMDQNSIVSANTQDGPMVTNGQQTQMPNIKPLAPGGLGTAVAGTMQQAIPPVTTETTDPITGRKSTVGILPPAPVPGRAPASATREAMQIQPTVQQGRDGEAVRMMQEELSNEKDPVARAALQREIVRAGMNQAKGQPQQAQAAAAPSYSFPTSLPTGKEKAILGTADVVNEDHKSAAVRAGDAAKTIGILNNIKQYAPNAITGYAGDTRQMIAGLQSFIANKLSMNTDDFAKIKTDELQKNTKMLALAGGDTNLAKNLAEVSNPNTKMDTPAIISTANQLIARNKLDVAEFKFKDQFKGVSAGHPEIYTQAMKAFNDINDHRLMQFGAMSDKEKSELKASMSAADQKDFGKKLEKGRQLGIIPKAGEQ